MVKKVSQLRVPSQVLVPELILRLTTYILKANSAGNPKLKVQLLAFIRRWNIKDGHPFNWTFKGYPIQSKEAA